MVWPDSKTNPARSGGGGGGGRAWPRGVSFFQV